MALNWSYIFAGVSAAASLGYLAMQKNAQASAPAQSIVYPALNEQAMVGPTVPAYNASELALPVNTQNQGVVPNYITYNQGPNRVQSKAQDYMRRMRKKAMQNTGCCDSCKTKTSNPVASASISNQADNYNSTYTNWTNFSTWANAELL